MYWLVLFARATSITERERERERKKRSATLTTVCLLYSTAEACAQTDPSFCKINGYYINIKERYNLSFYFSDNRHLRAIYYKIF